jgi:hypothetical protein
MEGARDALKALKLGCLDAKDLKPVDKRALAAFALVHEMCVRKHYYCKMINVGTTPWSCKVKWSISARPSRSVTYVRKHDVMLGSVLVSVGGGRVADCLCSTRAP